MKIVVVGGGFWGAATALIARKAGHEAVLLDDGNPHGASRNAAGMVHPEWYKRATGDIYRIPNHWSKAHITESIDWLVTEWGASDAGELFSSYYAPERWRHKPGLRTLRDPMHILQAAEPVRAHVSRLARVAQGWVAQTTTGDVYEATAVILATGAWTDDLLRASGYPELGVTILRGHALVVGGTFATDIPMTRYVAPYRHYTLRPWQERGQWRLGDTVERTISDDRAAATLETLRAFGGTMLPDLEERTVLDGYRPIWPKRGMGTIRIDTGLIVATGGHRIGLGVAALVAHEALQRTEENA